MIWPIDGTLTVANSPGLSEPVCYDNAEGLHISKVPELEPHHLIV